MDIGECKDRTEQQTAEAGMEKNSFRTLNAFLGIEQCRRYVFAQVLVLYQWKVSSGRCGQVV
jgi:hypothetical protein